MRRATIALGIVAILAGSCGGTELPARLATTLQDQVASIRERAEAGRPGLARAELRELVALVTSRLDAGAIEQGRAMEILEAAQAVAEQLASLPRSSPSESPSPSPSEDEEGRGDGKPGKGKGNGGGEGHGNDD